MFARSKVIAILRGFSPTEAVRRATIAWDSGVELVEVPIQSELDIESLRAVLEAGRVRSHPVGAGTVVNPEQVRLAKDLGCGFTVAPGLNREVAEISTDLELPHMPGIATATELQAATDLGLSWVKVFPAAGLGTSWFQAMRGPFPDAHLIAVGGIDARNAQQFIDAGADGVGVGSALADPQQLRLLGALLT